jgi:hypothetical protein
MSSKVSNALPPLGGMTGVLFEVLPNFTTISQTIVLAIVGAVVGYLVKIGLDRLFKKEKT